MQYLLLCLCVPVACSTPSATVQPPDRDQVRQILDKKYGPGPPALEIPQAEQHRQQFLEDKQAYLADPSSFELPLDGPNACPGLDPTAVGTILHGEPLAEASHQANEAVRTTYELSAWRVVEGACNAGDLQGEATIVGEVVRLVETNAGEGWETSTNPMYHHLRGDFSDSRLDGPYFHFKKSGKTSYSSRRTRRLVNRHSTPELVAILESPWLWFEYGARKGGTIASTTTTFGFQPETSANKTTVREPLGGGASRTMSYDGVDLAAIFHTRDGEFVGEWRSFARVSNRGDQLPAQRRCYENGKPNPRVTCEGPDITGERSAAEMEQHLLAEEQRLRRAKTAGERTPPPESSASSDPQARTTPEPAASGTPGPSTADDACDEAAAHQASIVAAKTPSSQTAMQKAFAQQCRDEGWSKARLACIRSAESADAFEACAKASSGDEPASAAQCAEVAEHQAGIMSEKTPSMKPALQKAFDESCRSEGWSVARVECALDAESDAQIEECAGATNAPAVADEALCAKAGSHQASVMARSNPSMEDAFSKSFTKQCNDEQWSEARARCVLEANDADKFEACQ